MMNHALESPYTSPKLIGLHPTLGMSRNDRKLTKDDDQSVLSLLQLANAKSIQRNLKNNLVFLLNFIKFLL